MFPCPQYSLNDMHSLFILEAPMLHQVVQCQPHMNYTQTMTIHRMLEYVLFPAEADSWQ
jgi:hypothetical protein